MWLEIHFNVFSKNRLNGWLRWNLNVTTPKRKYWVCISINLIFWIMLLVSKLLHIPILAVNRRTWRLKKQLHWWVCVRIRHFTIRFVSTNVPVVVVMWCSSRCVKPDISQMQNVILCRLFRWNWLTIVLTIKRGWLLISVNISAASWQHRNR